MSEYSFIGYTHASVTLLVPHEHSLQMDLQAKLVADFILACWCYPSWSCSHDNRRRQ